MSAALPPVLRPRSYRSLWIVVAGIIVLADWLLWDRPIGCSAAVMTVALLLPLVHRRPTILRYRPPLVLLAALLGLILAMLLEPTPLVLACAAALLLWLVIFAQSRRFADATAWAWHLAASLLAGPVRAVLDHRLVRRWVHRHPTAGGRDLRWLLLWVLPVLLGGVFVGLFTLANPVIGRWVVTAGERLVEPLRRMPLLLDVLRITFWLAVALAAWMLLRTRPARTAAPASTSPAAQPPLPAVFSDATATSIVVRCLFVFNAIFAVQNALDARYLLGGGALPEGMTYAQYAQRGAYPLVAAAVLAGGFVVVTFRAGGASERSRAARVLVYAWLAQTVILTAAAVWRLDLYVSVFSLSRLRLAAGVWMALVALGLMWIALRIVTRRGNAWLVNANALTAGLVLYGLCFFDIDGFIAAYNVRHAREMGGAGVAVDLPYLRSLGPEALPALRALAAGAAEPQARDAADSAVAALESDLAAQLQDWRGWTLRRARLADLGARTATPSAPSPMALHDR